MGFKGSFLRLPAPLNNVLHTTCTPVQVQEWLTWVQTELTPLMDVGLVKLNDHLVSPRKHRLAQCATDAGQWRARNERVPCSKLLLCAVMSS